MTAMEVFPMDFMQSIRYPFDDEEWITKILIGMLISLVPILNFAAFGYVVQIIRNVARGEDRPLPRWDNLGDLFMKGLLFAIAAFVYVGIPYLIGMVIMMPLGLLPILAGESQDAAAALSAAGSLGMVCIGLIILVVVLVAGFILLAGLLRFSTGRQELGELFQFGENWRLLRENLGTLVMAYIYVLVAGLVLGFVLGCINVVLNIIPCIGTIIAIVISLPAMFYLMLVTGHIYGQAARQVGLAPGV